MLSGKKLPFVYLFALTWFIPTLLADSFIITDFPWTRPLKKGEFGIERTGYLGTAEKKTNFLGEPANITYRSDYGFLSWVSVMIDVNDRAKTKATFDRALRAVQNKFGKPKHRSFEELSAWWQPSGQNVFVAVSAPKGKKYVEILFRYYGSKRHQAESYPELTPTLGVHIDNKSGKNQVVKVIAGSTAEKAGLRVNDLITKINDKQVKSLNEVRIAMASLTWGADFSITFVRGGKTKQTTASATTVHPFVEVLVKMWQGKKAPNSRTTTGSGMGQQLMPKQKGNVVLLQFWASWCAICIQSGKELSEKVADDPKISLVFVSPQAIGIWRHFNPTYRNGITFRQESYGNVYRQYQNRLMGVIFIIDSKGIVQGVTGSSPAEVKKVWQKAQSLTK